MRSRLFQASEKLFSGIYCRDLERDMQEVAIYRQGFIEICNLFLTILDTSVSIVEENRGDFRL